MASEHGEKGRLHGLGALRHRAFALYWVSRICAAFAVEMQSTTVGWQVYRLTKDPLDLGFVGLAQFAPFILLFLVTGLVADRVSRVKILASCVAVQAIVALAFFVMTYTGHASFGWILALLVVFGVSRAFHSPIHQSITPNLVPAAWLGNAIAWSSTGNTISRIAGPAVAGVAITVGQANGWNELLSYGIAGALLVIAFALTIFIRLKGQRFSREPVSLSSVVAGLHFVWTRQAVFASIALDLFAVLLGNVTALLPVFAVDVLQVDAEGFGWLRASITAGAFAGALFLTQRPIRRGVGVKLLVSCAIFGVSVVAFGFSTSFYLSLATLFVMGLSDVVSVNIRHTMAQLITPDEMRGRVGAAVGVFVGASNEVGEFRAGVMAHWIGIVPAVVLGGAMTVAVVLGFAALFPVLRGMANLDPDALVRAYRPPHDRRGRRPVSARATATD
jgi:MFS family permease